MFRYDRDENATPKVIAEVNPPSNGTFLIDGAVHTYTPHAGFTGEDSFTFTASDGTTLSDEKTIFITVN